MDGFQYLDFLKPKAYPTRIQSSRRSLCERRRSLQKGQGDSGLGVFPPSFPPHPCQNGALKRERRSFLVAGISTPPLRLLFASPASLGRHRFGFAVILGLLHAESLFLP